MNVNASMKHVIGITNYAINIRVGSNSLRCLRFTWHVYDTPTLCLEIPKTLIQMEYRQFEILPVISRLRFATEE